MQTHGCGAGEATHSQDPPCPLRGEALETSRGGDDRGGYLGRGNSYCKRIEVTLTNTYTLSD